MNNKLKIFVSTVYLIFAFTIVCFAQQNLTVRGRVVDEAGKPVSKALVAERSYWGGFGGDLF